MYSLKHKRALCHLLSSRYLRQVACSLSLILVPQVVLAKATATEVTYKVAQMRVAEAESLRNNWSKDGFEKALKKYKEARLLWQALKLQEEEAQTLNAIGQVLSLTSNYRAALDSFNNSLTIYQATKNRPGEAAVLIEIGAVYLAMGNHQSVIEFCERAMLLNESRELKLDARALNYIADARHFLSDFAGSEAAMNRAQPLWESLNDAEGLAQCLGRRAALLADRGEMQEAFAVRERTLLLWQTAKNKQGEANALTNIGSQFTFVGEYQKSLDSHARALSIFQIIGDRKGEAVALGNIGYTYLNLGELDIALSYCKRAATLHREISNSYYEATMVAVIGDVYCATGKEQPGLNSYKTALAIFQAAGDKQWEALIQNSIGSTYLNRGDHRSARNAYSKALPLFRHLKNQRWEADTLNGLGSTFLGTGETQQARNYFNDALSRSRAANDLRGESLAHYNLARVERELGDMESAEAEIQTALKINEKLRSNIMSYQSRASYVASVHQYYEFYTDLLMRQHAGNPSAGFDAKAFEASERGRTRSLVEMLIEAREGTRTESDPALMERERELAAQLRKQIVSPPNNKKPSEAPRTTDEDVFTLNAQYEQLQAKLKTRITASSQPEPITTLEAQKLLDSDTLLLEYLLGDERSFLWVVSNSSINTFELPSRTRIESLARQLHSLLAEAGSTYGLSSSQERKRQNPVDRSQITDALGEILLGKVGSLLERKRLVVVADGALQYVPFSLLPEPALSGENGKPDKQQRKALIAQHDIAYLPSASVLAIQRRNFGSRGAAPYAVAVFADPVFESEDPRVLARQVPISKAIHPGTGAGTEASPLSRALRDVGLAPGKSGIPRLPFSRQEAIAINTATGGTTSLQALDFTANLQTLSRTDLSKYRIIHFATHGLLNSAHPELSGVLLSMVDEKGKPQDGFLNLHEIYNLNLRAELVVLSACQTALGKDIKGEGLIGLTRGFMYAGAARVVASLWKVDDAATAELMSQFYTEMFLHKKNPSAALRAAQLKVASHPVWQSPYYWAGFVLQGEWN